MANENQIYIITEVEEKEEIVAVDDDRSGRDKGGGWDSSPSRGPVEAVRQIFKRRRVALDVQTLKTQMQDLLGVVNELFDPEQENLTAQTKKGLELAEVTLSVEVNAKGELSILGTGGELGGSGGMRLSS